MKKPNIIITICARGGSKGVPGKNIRPLLGKPLIGYTIEQALAFPENPRIVVSTDDEKIKNIAQSYGLEVPFLRPDELASDTAPKIPAMIHAVLEAEKYWNEKYDIVVDLDPTNPLRELKHIQDMVQMLTSMPQTSVVFSVTEAAKNPYFNMVELDNNQYAFLCKKSEYKGTRQQAPKVYQVNSCIYVLWRDVLIQEQTVLTNRTRIYEMPEEASMEIDRPVDFEFVEHLMKKKLQKT